MNDWYAQFGGDDFTVVGVHYPEFNYERQLENVEAAIARLDIRYPVVLDNDGVAWRAFNQRYWPTRYLIDRAGNIRYKHIGEGAYAETAHHIEALLAEN